MANTPKKKKHKIWPWLIAAAVIVFVVTSLIGAGNQVKNSFKQAEAKVQDISTYYSFSGNLTPVTDEQQTAKTTATVKEVYAEEGQKVQEGDALLRTTDGSRVYAAATGTIEEMNVEKDDQLTPGAPIARIVDYDSLEVSVDVDEYDIAAMQEGKKGQVYINALDKEVEGTVSEVARNATTEGGVSYYEVKMQIEAAEGIRSGMSVEVNVLHEQALGAVTLSLDTISYDEYNKPFVLTLTEDGKHVPLYVETGISDGKNVQILSGLNEGDSIYYRSDDMARFFAMRQQMMGMGGDDD